MTLRNLLKNVPAALAALALLTSVGCNLGDVTTPQGEGEGEGDGDGDEPESQGERSFGDDVAPLLGNCAAAGCHTGDPVAQPLKFLGSGPENDYYSSITSYASVTGNFDPAVANLLLMVQGGTHEGQPDWNNEQKGKIVTWLQGERIERGLEPPEDPPDPGGVPVSTRQAFSQWAGCMTLENWDLAQMGTWAEKDADNDDCISCHVQGVARMFINNDNLKMFNMNRTELYIITFFVTAVADDGSVGVMPATEKIVRMSLGPPITLHQEYNADPDDIYMQRLEEFHALTQQNLEAGTCDPAGFFVP